MAEQAEIDMKGLSLSSGDAASGSDGGSREAAGGSGPAAGSMEAKMEEKLRKLKAADEARVKLVKERREKQEESPESESISKFYAEFRKDKKWTEGELVKLRDPMAKDLSKRIGPIEEFLVEMRAKVASAAYYLPPYDVGSYHNGIRELGLELERAKQSLLPRKPFKFRHRPSVVENGTDSTSSAVSSGEPSAEKAAVEDADILRYSDKERTLSGLEGQTIVRSDTKGGDWTLYQLVNCTVYLCGPVKALFVHSLHNCKVHCGPVSASCLIERVSRSTIMVATHQFRMHTSSDCTLLLCTRSDPIVETCSSLSFGPYRFQYDGLSKDMSDAGLDAESAKWKNVKDFDHPGAVGPSPSWSYVPRPDEITMVQPP